MPVTGLYYISDPSPLLLPTLADRLFKHHQPLTTHPWTFEYRTFRETPNHLAPTLGGSRTMQQLDLSYTRGKMFVLIGEVMVQVEREFEYMVKSKLNGLWAPSHVLRAEGHTYELDDWRIRFGGLSQNGQHKGVVVEVEYYPCEYIEEGAGIVRGILAPIVKDAMGALKIAEEKGRFYGDAVQVEGKEREAFTVMDTGRQYMEMLRMQRTGGKLL